MYSLAEAEAEMQADEDAGLRNDDGHEVVHAVASKKPKSSSSGANASRARSSTFFQKMFSAKNMDRAINGKDGEDNEDEEGDEKVDGDADNAARQQQSGTGNGADGKDIDDNASNASMDSLAREIEAKNAQQILSKRYPPLPYLGTPINFDRLVARNRLADEGMVGLMELVNMDVQEAIQRAKQVPVQDDLDRVTVTPEVSTYMAKVKSRKGLEKRLTQNTADIQKALAYRKSALIVMNSNYSNKTVRKIDPIYAQEARTIIRAKDT